MANDWYYSIGGDTQQGPVPKEQIESMLSSGDLKPETLICSSRSPQWTKAEDIDELKWERPFVPPPLPAAKSMESAEDVAIPEKRDQPSTWDGLALGMGSVAIPEKGNQPSKDALHDFPTDYAGFWKRVAAHIIDSIILLFAGFVYGSIFAAAGVYGVGPVYIFTYVSWWIYYAVMESSPTQGTLGKMALGIKVTDLKGSRISFGRASGRHFGKFISALILSIGFIMVAFTQKKQGLHDGMAGCLVVNK